MLRRALFIALLALGVAACGDDDSPPADAGEDAGEDEDAGVDPDGGVDPDAGDPDAGDPDAGGVEDCTNGTDDDGDDDVDCDDADCDDAPTCNPEVDCDDVLDNDLDGDIDCDDSDCAANPSCDPELVCNDGLDDDGDGATDCDDSDCAASPFCTPEADCGNATDDDGDGVTDCDDSDCAAACATGCPATSTAVTISATDLPQAIGVATATSLLAVATDGVVTGVAVGVDVTHIYVGDVDLRLTSPAGITSELSINHGTSGDNYTDTLFTDSATTWIGDGTAPYTGSFQPDEPLALHDGGPATGTWELEAFDNYPSLDDGTLDSVDLYLCICNGTAGCEFGLACRDGVSNDDDADVDCDDSDCAADPSCLPEADCADGLDGDFDGFADCLDGDCDGVDVCELGTELTCDDGADNDGDGDADCTDDNCDGVAGCELGTEVTCDDGLDNDADDLEDCADADCAADAYCLVESVCDDGADNDADGATDCSDADCDSSAFCSAETDCGDGTDDDSDGATDCEDPGCDGIDGCELGSEASCDDGFDNDADGAVDCADTECAGLLLCAITSCPAGTSKVIYTATDLPVLVPDFNVGGSGVSTITVADTGLVADIAVGFSINHAWDEDLDIDFSAPGGDNELSTDNGGSADNYINTRLTDSAAASITTGAAPFTGVFRPEAPFAPLYGSPLDGDFVFTATDDEGGIDGTITAYAILVCACDGTAGACEFGQACRDGLDNDGNGDTDCEEAACAADAFCIPEADCDDAIDNDLDAAADCLDDDCDGIGICEVGVEVTCDDGFDNDSDTFADCFDADCDTASNCLVETVCDDGVDDDGDGAFDCDDSDCAATLYCTAEADCDDGLDDDADGVLDCQDPGCDGTGGCEFGGEVSCDDGIDNDSDGNADCLETACAGLPICLIASCPAGTSKYAFTSTDVPKAIPDLATGTSTIAVADLGLVADVAVRVNIAHTFDADVDLSLTAPGGSNDLSSDNGSGGDNFTNTVFVDSAPTSITTGSAPFTGSFQPEELFASLYGTPLEGDWDLVGTDDESGAAGTINSYQLLVCACDFGSGACEFGEACRDGLDNDENGDTDCEEAACATDPFCIPEANCTDGLDEDLDGDADCADADCDGLDGCELGAEATCDDGFDNDGDGDGDCADSDCAADAFCIPETDCGDAVDNDGDALADCADPGCDGVDGCTFGVEDSCNDLVDNDGDGLIDAAEDVCTWVVAALPTCAAGNLHGYRATDLPQAISTSGPPNIRNSFIPVAGTGTVADLAVRINIAHTYVSDLDVLLFSPTGTSRELSTDNGGSGDNFTNTVFVDSAAAVIGTTGNNTAPFAGSYRPEQAFAPTLVGETVTGSWNLRVTDQFSGDGGTMNEFSVGVCLQ
jgi:subtilisin-like proprotein convertase family protein